MQSMKIEFWMWPDGKIMYKPAGGEAKEFTEKSTEVIEEVRRILVKRYPQTYAELKKMYERSRANHTFYNYIIIERFIRCNFASHDGLADDIDGDKFNFEEVSCPLRGRCRHEGVVCMPKAPKIVPELSPEQNRICQMYVEGMDIAEIARNTYKSESTVNNQIAAAAKTLGCKRHELAKYFLS